MTLRYKDSFFLQEETGQTARRLLHSLVEAEYESLGVNNNGEAEDHSADENGSSSILHSLRKRICRERERHIEVHIYQRCFRSSKFPSFPQDPTASVASTIDAYLKLPLEEFKCLRLDLKRNR